MAKGLENDFTETLNFLDEIFKCSKISQSSKAEDNSFDQLATPSRHFFMFQRDAIIKFYLITSELN